MNAPLIVVTALSAAVLLSACNRAPVTPAPNAPTSTAPSNTVPTITEPTKQALADTVVTTKVKAALLAASDVNSTSISVETRDGRVTLTGKLPDAAQIQRAITVARGVEGVKDVDSQLAAGTS